MRSHQHTLETTLNIILGAEVEWDCRVTGTYHPYQRAYTPRGEYAPIDPPEPAAFEWSKIEISPIGKNEWREFPHWLVTEEQMREIEREALQDVEGGAW